MTDVFAMDVYQKGSWSCSYAVHPVPDPPSLSQFKRILEEVKGNETGWPPWLSLENRPGMGMQIRGGLIECWLKDTPDADFWRADPTGLMFLIRRLQEDTDFPKIGPGTFFDLTLPIWRTGECMLHAVRLARKLDAEQLDLTMAWEGLVGRELRALASPIRTLLPGRRSSEDSVSTDVTAPIATVLDALPELVKQLLDPLYARFGFYEAPDELYSAELHKMRTRSS